MCLYPKPKIMMKKTDSNILSHLWTAEKANERALFEMWHDWSVPSIWDIETDKDESDDERGHYIECVVPDVKTAKAYYKARHIRECYYGGMPSLLDRSYTSEEAEEYSKMEKRFRKMHLDMRDQVFTGDNGKKGLRDVCGAVLIEPQFDDFSELYTCFERPRLIPVVLNNRYYLYDIKKCKLLTKGYERIFHYFWAYMEYFVVVENGKKGILDGFDGTEATPIDLDEVYSMPDPDGDIPVVKDGKIGLLWGKKYTQPIFEDIFIESEEWTRVKLNGKWGWVDGDGKFTLKKSDVLFGSWYDFSK